MKNFLEISSIKPKITITNSQLYRKFSEYEFKNDSSLRKEIESDYRNSVTRILNDEELCNKFKENLVENILVNEYKTIKSSNIDNSLKKSLKKYTNQAKLVRISKKATQKKFKSPFKYDGDNFVILNNSFEKINSAPNLKNRIELKVKIKRSMSQNFPIDRRNNSMISFKTMQSSNPDSQNGNICQDQNKNLNLNSRSITRNQKQIKAKSMDVDKWINVHKRRSTIISKDLNHQINGNDLLKNLEIYSKSSQTKSRSIRELSELTVLDLIQERKNREIKENIRNLRRKHALNEFNSIVVRIKAFLDDLDNYMI
ncbi:unnamed protein product [Brachionus calyciflorus]|uniref:Uncharacterized protein n=1 Tax=Brachionus calyciflorus TaxID=104777 RepID=A0A813RF05_9BILA|nr:unnamed protein product [Brachionus calyciflorus]